MVPEIENSGTDNFRTRIILAWLRILDSKKHGPTVFHGESAATFSFGKNPDFEGVSPYTRSPISVQRFRQFLGADSTQATQNFSIGVILDAESDGNEFFLKLENFTISRNKLRVQPYQMISGME